MSLNLTMLRVCLMLHGDRRGDYGIHWVLLHMASGLVIRDGRMSVHGLA